MIIYIAGPMSGLPDHNYPLFEATRRSLEAQGHEVLSPTDIGQHVGWPWERYMGAALVMQARAEVTYLLPGWRQSRGARIEHEHALALGHGLLGSQLDGATR